MKTNIIKPSHCASKTIEPSPCFLYIYFTAISLAFIVASLFTGPIGTLLPGLAAIATSTQYLTVDACAVGGLNGSLLNAGLLGLFFVIVLIFTRIKPTGASVSAYFLTIGFSFFGKNIINIWPIIIGAYLYSRYKKEPFGNYVHFGFFGGALAPVVSEMVFPSLFNTAPALGIPLGLFVGVLIGFLIPPLSVQTFKAQKGYNLYNVGFSAGLLGMAFFAVYRTFFIMPKGLGDDFKLNTVIGDGFPLFFSITLAVFFVISIAVGFVLNGWTFNAYKSLLMETGHDMSFTNDYGSDVTFINIGFLGLIFLAYFIIVGAPFNGPVVGGLLCVVCLAGLGSHPRNTLPIMLGYVLASMFADWSLNTMGIAVGICFATGMSPISGRWGWYWGLAAGVLHASLVTSTAMFHGGFNIYNGGFASGLVALVLVPCIGAISKDKDPMQ